MNERTDRAYQAGAGAVMAQLERMAKDILSGPPRDERHAEAQRRIRREIEIMERIIDGAKRRGSHADQLSRPCAKPHGN